MHFFYDINLYVSSAGEFSAKEGEHLRDERKKIPIPYPSSPGNKMRSFIISIFILVLLVSTFADAQDKRKPLKTVKSVDLKRYAGLWYEIAKIPNRFQKKCVAGTTAEYTLLENGNIQVINRCQEKDGNEDAVKGVARVVDAETNARLKVSFVRFLGRNWFWGDYWIIGLDEKYQWAVIGHPNRKYGWILARSPKMEVHVLERCNAILREQGYDPNDFVSSKH